MDGRQLITKNLKQIISSMGVKAASAKGSGEPRDIEPEVNPDLIGVKISPNLENGDYYTNVALRLGSELKQKPLELAEKIAEEYKKLGDSNIKRVEAVNPGFINFFLSDAYLSENLIKILEQGDEYGRSQKNKGKKVIVEFSSPNIAKPFTVGHLRSTIIGASIANLLSATGWEVARDNHIGDWGTQFGKQIYAIKTWGDEAKIEKSKNPVKDLVALYIKFHEEAAENPKLEDEGRAWFKKLEEGDPEARRLWKKCVDWSVLEFNRLYNSLNVMFTENNGSGYSESFFEDKMKPVITELRSKDLLKTNEGAELIFFPEDKYPPLMVLKQDGTTLYATRDLATDKFRLLAHGRDTVIINEVGVEQSLYFQQLYEVEKMLGWIKSGQRIHVKHGHFRFRDSKMSTRQGNVVWLEEVLDEAKKRAKSLSETNGSGSDKIGIGALKWNELKRDSLQDIVFDWNDILNMQGNSGPYLQYTYVRTQSVIKKSQAGHNKGHVGFAGKTLGNDSKLEKEEIDLLRLIVHFPEVVESAAVNYSPSELCTYLFGLAQVFNLFYQKHQIIAAVDPDARSFRLALTSATGQIVKSGLALLGIETVEKM